MAPSRKPSQGFVLTDEVFTALFDARDKPLEIVDTLSLPPSEIEAFREAHPDLTESESRALRRLYTAARHEQRETVRKQEESPQREHIGKYVVHDVLSTGGLSRVFRAYDPDLDRKVAIELYRTDAQEELNARAKRAGLALAKLCHPNIVSVFDVGMFESQVFVVQELVEGKTLREWQGEQRASKWEGCVQAYLEAGHGLAAMHSAGLVYGDFKPENCIVDRHGHVYILTSPLAKPLHASSEARDANAVPGVEAALLVEKTIVGTPAYMSPEQLTGRAVDERSDQFNFCVALYEAICDVRPFVGPSNQGIIRRAPPGALMPPKLWRALLRGLDADPTRRWPSMNPLLTKLQRIAFPPVTPVKPWLVVAMAAAGAVAGVGVAASVQSGSTGFHCEDARARLDEIWNEQRKDEVRSAVLDTARSDASELWVQVEWGLDSYARAWIARYEQACEAEEEENGDRALRVTCLSNRRAELEAALGTLELTDEAPMDVVSGLTPLSACDDVDALRKKL